MVINLLEVYVYIVILALMTLTLFQGHRCVRNINCKLRVLDFCPLFKCCMVATYIKKIMNSVCPWYVFFHREGEREINRGGNVCACTRGCTDTERESALKVDSGKKSLCRTGESNLRHWRDGPML